MRIDESFRSPQRIESSHQVDGFNSGVPSLDIWLRRRACANESAGASRTYVSCIDETVAGYYAISAGAVLRDSVSGHIARNMPDPIPVILIGRLAVANASQGKGLGRSLLIDALRRCMVAGEIIGVRAVTVHAISEPAQKFYEQYGFVEAPGIVRTLSLIMQDVRRLLDG